MKQITAMLAVLVVVIALIYGGFRFNRWWNYKFGYESLVRAEVQKQLKPVLERISVLESNAIIPFVIANTNK